MPGSAAPGGPPLPTGSECFVPSCLYSLGVFVSFPRALPFALLGRWGLWPGGQCTPTPLHADPPQSRPAAAEAPLTPVPGRKGGACAPHFKHLFLCKTFPILLREEYCRSFCNIF